MDIITHLLASNNIIQITPIIFCILFTAGIGAGVVGAIVGGGGLIVVPSLLALGAPPHVAFATSKMQAIFGSTSAIVQYHRKGLIDKEFFPIAWLLTMFWSIIGSLILKNTSTEYIGKIMPFFFSLILIYKIVFFSHGLVRKEKPLISRKLFIIIFTCILGLYDGFFGPGIGTLWTFAFATFAGMDLLNGSANSRLMNFASTIGALIIVLPSGLVCFKIGIIMGVAQSIGSRIGVYFAVKKGAKFINIAFVVILTIIIINLFSRYY